MDDKRRDKIIKYSGRVGSNMDPVSIQAGITDDCYQECYMCSHYKRKKKHMISAVNWCYFLKFRKDLESVCYSGGDFLKHPEANEIMEYHLKKGLAFGLLTSGYASDSIDLKLLRHARWVRVSLDTINPWVYHENRGGELTVEMVLKSIHRMKVAGVNVELTITVHKHNSDYLDELFKWACNNQISIDIHPIFGRSFTKDEHTAIARWKFHFERKGLTFQDHQFNKYNFTKCASVYYQCFIDAKGDIYPCCNAAGDTRKDERMKPLGNISDWDSYLEERNCFYLNELQDFCKNCIDRFRSINNVCDSIRNKQSFF